MFMCCTKISSVINLIYSGQLFSYEANAECLTHLTLNYIITLLILTETKLNQMGLAFVNSSLISSSVPWLLLLICKLKIFSIKLILIWTKSLYIIYGLGWIGSYKSPKKLFLSLKFCSCIGIHLNSYMLPKTCLELACPFNRTGHIRHQCRTTTVLSCHRCLIKTGVEKMNNI